MKRIILAILPILLLGVGIYQMITHVYAEGTQQKKQTNEVGTMYKIEQKHPVNQQEYQPALDTALKLLAIPDGYEMKNVRSGKQNESEVWVFRYEKSNGENNGLGGEHYSFTVEKETHKILGFTWMNKRFISGQKLPTKNRTEKLAKSFIDQVEPDLSSNLKNLWTEAHDETIKVGDKIVTVTGMKYKCRLQDGDTYAWVIVGPDGKIITFEQGIQWENGRVTEKWLHDSWLKNNL